jgi:glycosyltransferase involved in cell wall biosynthesis
MSFPSPTQTFAGNDLLQLRKMGHQVDVYTLLASDSNADVLKNERSLEDVPVSALTAYNYFLGCAHILLRPLVFLRLIWLIFYKLCGSPRVLLKSLVLIPRVLFIINQIVRSKPDVVHLFWGHYPALLLVGLSMLKNRPVLSMFLGAYDLELAYPMSTNAVVKADLCFTHAHVNLSKIEQIHGCSDKFHVIHRGIYFPNLDVCEKNENHIVTCSALSAGKKVDLLLVKFAKARKKISSLVLTVIGDGPELESLKALAVNLGIHDSVRFLGRQPHEKVYKLMNEAKYFWFFSQKPSERLPNALKEAMYSGCISFVLFTPGMDEIVTHGNDGYLYYDHEDPGFLSDFEAVFFDKEVQGRVSRAAHNKVVDKFSVSHAMSLYSKDFLSMADLIARK